MNRSLWIDLMYLIGAIILLAVSFLVLEPQNEAKRRRPVAPIATPAALNEQGLFADHVR